MRTLYVSIGLYLLAAGCAGYYAADAVLTASAPAYAPDQLHPDPSARRKYRPAPGCTDCLPTVVEVEP